MSESHRQRQLNQDLRYCYSDHICSYTQSRPDYVEQLNIILASPTIVAAEIRAGYNSPLKLEDILWSTESSFSAVFELKQIQFSFRLIPLLSSHKHRSLLAVSFTLHYEANYSSDKSVPPDDR